MDNETVRKCPIKYCKSFTVGDPVLPCAVHGVQMVVDGGAE